MDTGALQSADDHMLVAAVAEGSTAALAEVYRRHGPGVTALARRLLGDNGLAEDVTQEVFVHLWRHAARFDPARGKLRTMLLTQAHGKSVDVIRARNARDRREEKVEAATVHHDREIDAELMAITEARLVQDALTRLPADERTAIELAYFGGNTYREVAALLGIPEGTVKGRIRTGLRRLHTLLSDPDDPAASQAAPSTAPTRPKKDQPWTA